ncbi:transposase [Desulfosarcina sp.]|uniref:REP-associated tyrosine transposase n=1 Tax=Desulfosarcina sp. TaxID=2027861 RepID=UPI00356524EE
MSRPLRIEYPDAWYHVMNRGRRSEKVFFDKDDFQAFIQVMMESSEMWNLRISAYCLMPNHYHLLVQTPDANIARCMRHINGVYTQRFNSRHHSEGQLFKGRYKSILVSADAYLLQLVRYIHRNPVKAGLADKPEAYAWSSHKAYLSGAKKWEWLNKAFIYSLLTENRQRGIYHYRKYMDAGGGESVASVIDEKKWPSMIGPADFLDWVKGKYYNLKQHEDVPESKKLAPSVELINQIVCDFYRIQPDGLYKSQRGVFNEPRNSAIYLVRKMRHDTLKEIGDQFNLEKYSSVSSIVERMKRQIDDDSKLGKRIEQLTKSIHKSQKQT